MLMLEEEGCAFMFALHQFLLTMALQVIHLNLSVDSRTSEMDIFSISYNEHYFLLCKGFGNSLILFQLV